MLAHSEVKPRSPTKRSSPASDSSRIPYSNSKRESSTDDKKEKKRLSASLSAEFFKNVLNQPKTIVNRPKQSVSVLDDDSFLPPPPSYNEALEIGTKKENHRYNSHENVSDSMVSAAFSDASMMSPSRDNDRQGATDSAANKYHRRDMRRRETVAAVAQMKERLRGMGILRENVPSDLNFYTKQQYSINNNNSNIIDDDDRKHCEDKKSNTDFFMPPVPPTDAEERRESSVRDRSHKQETPLSPMNIKSSKKSVCSEQDDNNETTKSMLRDTTTLRQVTERCRQAMK
jgi:hypothetical protein